MNRNSILEEHDYEISFVEDVLGLAKTLMQSFYASLPAGFPNVA